LQSELNLAWQPPAIQCRPDKHFRELSWSFAFHLHKNVLLYHIGHFFLLLLSLVHFLLQFGDLLGYGVEPVSVW
jgi:hypothetical protein